MLPSQSHLRKRKLPTSLRALSHPNRIYVTICGAVTRLCLHTSFKFFFCSFLFETLIRRANACVIEGWKEMMESARNLLMAEVMFGVLRNCHPLRIISSSWLMESSGGSLRLIDCLMIQTYLYFLKFRFFLFEFLVWDFAGSRCGLICFRLSFLVDLVLNLIKCVIFCVFCLDLDSFGEGKGCSCGKWASLNVFCCLRCNLVRFDYTGWCFSALCQVWECLRWIPNVDEGELRVLEASETIWGSIWLEVSVSIGVRNLAWFFFGLGRNDFFSVNENRIQSGLYGLVMSKNASDR